MFEKRIKKLPVFDKNHMIGLVSLIDIAHCQPAIMKISKSFAAMQNTPKKKYEKFLANSLSNKLMKYWKQG